MKCRLARTLMTPTIEAVSTATNTAASPAADAAASESSSHRWPAASASPVFRHGGRPSASLGASARTAPVSSSVAARIVMPELFMPTHSHADRPLKKS
ncbi:MAG TPA: hypothetical protein VH589_28875, partial [Trebonia sp.]